MTCGIYEIKCLSNGKSYLGSSSNLKKRFSNHKSRLRSSEHGNIHLQNAWNKYGEKNFSFEILEYCTHEELISKEQEWLDFYYLNNQWSSLFNFRTIANSNIGLSCCRGRKLSLETKGKISKSHLGKKLSTEHREKLLHIVRNRSLETRRKMSESRKGIHLSKETKAKMSILQKGRQKPIGFQDGIKNHRYETKLSAEAKEKFLEAGKLANIKNWLFKCPSGETVEITNLSLFCRENNLSSSKMCLVYQGKRNFHRGWTKA